MRNGITLIGLVLALAGCVQKLPGIVVASKTDGAIELRALYIVQMQRIDDQAAAWCRSLGNRARLQERHQFDEHYISFRYECVSK